MTIKNAREDVGEGAMTSVATSPIEAYIQWICEAPFTGWNANPTQPCLLYKVYRDVPRIPLDCRIPLRLPHDPQTAPVQHKADLLPTTPMQKLAWLLYYTHGLTRVMRPAPGSLLSIPPTQDDKDRLPDLPRIYSGPEAHHHPFLGRPVPSGGNLHPVEMYLALGPQWDIPAGIYHYDSVHHALDQLRVGDYIADILACLPQGARFCPAILLPACFFQKNYQKYENMSYCLQNLDTGIVVEQLSFIAHQLSFTTTRHLQFIDTLLHPLVGLDVREECIYAAISLNCDSTHFSHQKYFSAHKRNNEAEIPEQPPIETTYVQPFVPRPLNSLLKNLYAASLLDKISVEADVVPAVDQNDKERKWLSLPTTDFANNVNLAQVLLRRRTSFCAIDTRALEQVNLAAVLAPLKTLPDSVWQNCACDVYCVIRRVQGIPEGVYLYNKDLHALTLVHSEEILPLLMRLTTAPNIHPYITPLSLFFCGDHLRARDSFGERGLRLMEIEIGCALQRVTLAAAMHNLATHIHRSYLLKATAKRLLRLPSPSQLPFASVIIGYPKLSQGGLFESAWY